MTEVRILGIELSRIKEMYVRDTGFVSLRDRKAVAAYDPDFSTEIDYGPDFVDVGMENGTTFRVGIHNISSVVYD